MRSGKRASFLLVAVCMGLPLAMLASAKAASPGQAQAGTDPAPAGRRSLHLVDLDADGQLDKLCGRADGSLRVEMNRGRGDFEEIVQQLPPALPGSVLTTDLDGDGFIDLYLVGSDRCLALVGDGTGRLREATEDLGLVHNDLAQSAERTELDGTEPEELILRTPHGDVVFWPMGGRFLRDEDSSSPNLATYPPEPMRGVGNGASAVPHPDRNAAVTLLEVGPPSGDSDSKGPVGIEVSGTSRLPLTVTATPFPPSGALPFLASCAPGVDDDAGTGCLHASSTPELGKLYPLSPSLFVSPAGLVGVGMTNPSATLDVNGQIRTNGTVDVVGTDGITKLFSNAQIDLRNPTGITGLSMRGRGSVNDLRLMDASGNTTVSLNGLTGRTKTKTIEITGGADIVEGFESTEGCIEPGTVLIADPASPGMVLSSSAPYDSKVIGVVSGAGGIGAGLQLVQAGSLEGTVQVGLVGRLYVLATAANGPISIGDRLTTSSLKGHAMRVSDAGRGDGAVLGKALTELRSGEGLVLTLVNLQ